MHRCLNCYTELTKQARFCNICGSPQTTAADTKTLPASPQPSPTKSLIPTRTIHPGTRHTSLPQKTDENYLRPKTASRPPIFPTHPTVNGVKSPAALPQRDPSQTRPSPLSTSSPSLLNSSNQAFVPEAPKPPEQISSIHNFDEMPTCHLSAELSNGRNGLANATTMYLLTPESFAATTKAAEHWRKSWRDRQYAEAGLAEVVSRGQAHVPMPLMVMQQSFARMRAIARTNNQQQDRHSINFGSWITIFLMICLILGLGAYVISTYLPTSPSGAAKVVPQANSPQPSLTIQGTTSFTFAKGQVIHLHGKYFSANATITFLLDTTTPINNTSTKANSQGAFDVAFPIGTDWPTGSHSIEAIDGSSDQNAFLAIQVIPAGAPATTSPDLSVTMEGMPVQLLTFSAVHNQRNPEPQRITITNTSGDPLKWSATTSSSNNLSWLSINDNHTYGQLAVSQSDTLLISVNIVGLTSSKKPYAGQVVFTINDNQLLTLPVQLQISDATPEMVFSPNPIIAQIAGNTCQSGVTLTLINLGTEAIRWSVNPDDDIKDKIEFVNNGQLMETGTLLPSGQPGDTQVLTLRCNGVQVGHHYHVSLYANAMSWSELVIIQ